MDDVTKYFLLCDNNDPVEIKGAKNLDDARQWASNSLSTYNFVRVIEVLYRPISHTPYIVSPTCAAERGEEK